MGAADTIYALASGTAKSAISVIRLSGAATFRVLSLVAPGQPLQPGRLSVRWLKHPQTGEILDQGMAVWLPGPRSFTGEDCGELHVHGSSAVHVGVCEALSSIDGVRPAEPGEFTRRAFIAGKMDAVEVEGLGDLLDARTSGQRRLALHQLAGFSSDKFDSWRERLLSIRADIEAVIDFSDDDATAARAAVRVEERLRSLVLDIGRAVDAGAAGEVIRDGVRVILAGHPNTGKSSLLNVLARRDVAIVSPVPGTTRDTIEVHLDLGGIPVILTDTAGLREAPGDIVEMEGIRRTRESLRFANIVIWVWAPDVEGSEQADLDQQIDIMVRTKADLSGGASLPSRPGESGSPAFVSTSSKTGMGIDQLISILGRLVVERYVSDEPVLLIGARQQKLARDSIRFLNEAIDSDTLEVRAELVRLAADSIGSISGKINVEEWLGAIFSRFCIGK